MSHPDPKRTELFRLYGEFYDALRRDDREKSVALQLQINEVLGVKYCPSCGRALPLEKEGDS